jgi:hypothetical protein
MRALILFIGEVLLFLLFQGGGVSSGHLTVGGSVEGCDGMTCGRHEVGMEVEMTGNTRKETQRSALHKQRSDRWSRLTIVQAWLE